MAQVASPRCPAGDKLGWLSVYHQLDPSKSQIRVLEFEERNAPDDAGIVLTLRTISLTETDHPAFDTLSYVWGMSNLDHTITVNDVFVPVTRSLYSALDDVRQTRSNSRLWWIDAICINQADPQERVDQVSMMGQVYRSSTRTVAYLGECSDLSAAVTLTELLVVVRQQRNCMQAIMQMAKDPAFSRDWRGLESLLRVEYWTRAWILQECIVSKNVEVFSRDGSWLNIDRLLDALMFIDAAESHITDALWRNAKVYLGHTLTNVKTQLALRYSYHPATGPPQPLQFLRAMLDALRLKASDPRDHVYAVLAMSRDGKGIVGPLDYLAPVAQVYAQLVQRYYHHHGSLDLILLSNMRCRTPGMPSWIPDLSSFEDPNFVPTLVQRHLKFVVARNDYAGRPHNADFYASDHRTGIVEFATDLRSLSVQGVLVGRINGLGGWLELTMTQGDRAWIGERHDCEQEDPSQQSSRPTNRAVVFEAVARSLTFSSLAAVRSQLPDGLLGLLLETAVQDFLSGQSQSIFSSALASFWENHKYLVIGGQTLSAWIAGDDRSEETREKELKTAFVSAALKDFGARPIPLQVVYNELLSRIGHVTLEMQRRIMVTCKEDVGLAPVDCQLGDECWILLGCNIPVILRRVHVGDFALVGEAYLHNFMHGQALRRPEVNIRSCRLV